MKVVDAIGKGFTGAKKSLNLILLLFILNVVWNLSTMSFTGTRMQDVDLAQTNPIVALISILFIFINIFIEGGVLGVLKDSIVTGANTNLGTFAKYGAKFYLRFLGMGLFVFLILILIGLIISLIIGISTAVSNFIATVVSVILTILLVVGVAVSLFLLFFSPYTLVVDDIGVLKAMGNSIRFVKSHVWNILGLGILILLVGLGIGFIAGIALGLISLILKGAAYQIVTSIISGALSSYLTIVVSVALINYYMAQSGGQKEETAAQVPVS